eukprot:Skav204713  [mRNA]  locus=scaffold3332:253423:278306:- [translate_table: standard]
MTRASLGEGRPRMLSQRECARLQGFPEPRLESYKLEHCDDKHMAWYRAIGNAVSVPVVAAVAEAILDALGLLRCTRASLLCVLDACQAQRRNELLSKQIPLPSLPSANLAAVLAALERSEERGHATAEIDDEGDLVQEKPMLGSESWADNIKGAACKIDGATRAKLLKELDTHDDAKLHAALVKSEGARKRFIAELHAKRNLEQLKAWEIPTASQRLQKADEDREARLAKLKLIKKQQHARAEAHKASEEAKKSTMAQLEVLMKQKEAQAIRRLIQEKDAQDRGMGREQLGIANAARQRRKMQERSAAEVRAIEEERAQQLARKRDEQVRIGSGAFTHGITPSHGLPAVAAPPLEDMQRKGFEAEERRKRQMERDEKLKREAEKRGAASGSDAMGTPLDWDRMGGMNCVDGGRKRWIGWETMGFNLQVRKRIKVWRAEDEAKKKKLEAGELRTSSLIG